MASVYAAELGGSIDSSWYSINVHLWSLNVASIVAWVTADWFEKKFLFNSAADKLMILQTIGEYKKCCLLLDLKKKVEVVPQWWEWFHSISHKVEAISKVRGSTSDNVGS